MFHLKILCAVVILILTALPLSAQQVPIDPASTHVFPAGGRRGTTVSLRVGGECLPPFTRLRWSGTGLISPVELGPKLAARGEPSFRRRPNELLMTYPKEWQSTVEIAADASLGAHLWRLASANGGVSGRYFLVGDLPEFIESEPNSIPERAERIELPVTLNGQIAGERDLDCFVFTAQAGDVVAAEVAAARLGSPLETLVEFYDAFGHLLVAEEARLGSDPVVAVKIPTAGEYRLVVSNLNYLGGPQFVYRITVSTAPLVKSVFPPGWQTGAPRIFELTTLTGDGIPRTLQETLTIAGATGAAGELWLPRTPGGAGPLVLQGGPHAEAVEAEPNAAAQPMPLPQVEPLKPAFPLTINGRFLTADDEDWFEFSAAKGAAFTIDCVPAPRSAPTLPVLSLHDVNGGPLAISSGVDHPDRRARFDLWSAPADGVYRIRVRDLRYKTAGGPELSYRLTIAPAVPDFTLSISSDFVNVVQGGKGEIDVRMRRKGGFGGPVKLSVADLPAGVTFDPHEFAPGQEFIKLAFLAAADARPGDVSVVVTGTAENAGTILSHVAAAAHLSRDAEGAALGPLTVDSVLLTVKPKPVFKLFCNEAYQYPYRGTVYPYLMEVERLSGFDGPITLEVADRQVGDLDGIEVLETTIPPGSSQVQLPLFLPETMHINVQAHSKVYSQGYAAFTDQWGQRQSVLVVSTMRCMLRPLPTIARLKSLYPAVACQPGSTATCRLQLDRTPKFTGPVTIELLSPTAEQGFTADAVVLAADQSTIDISVRVGPHLAPPLDAALVFRATGQLPDGGRMISQARIPLQVREATPAGRP